VPLGFADGLVDVAGVALDVTVGWVLGLGAVPLGDPPQAARATVATSATRLRCTR
jgi:hypothetical protein